jgi:hypothetical protein
MADQSMAPPAAVEADVRGPEAWNAAIAYSRLANLIHAIATVYDGMPAAIQPSPSTPAWKEAWRRIPAALAARDTTALAAALGCVEAAASAALGLDSAEVHKVAQALAITLATPPTPPDDEETRAATRAMWDLIDAFWEQNGERQMTTEELARLAARLAIPRLNDAHELTARLQQLVGRGWQASSHWTRRHVGDQEVLRVVLATGSEPGTWRLVPTLIGSHIAPGAGARADVQVSEVSSAYPHPR